MAPAAAVDVGAAPGGWTRLLARACAPVYAIDPANLDPDVVALPNVVHIKGLVGKRGVRGMVFVGCKEGMCVRGRTTTTFALGKEALVGQGVINMRGVTGAHDEITR